MENEEFYKLLDKYAEGQCSEAERIFVENWYASYNENETRQVLSEQNLRAVQDKLRGRIFQPEKQRSVFRQYRYVAAAAVLFLIITAAVVFYKQGKKPAEPTVSQTPILPGSNKAVLILAGGKKIDLTDAPQGQLSSEANTIVAKQDEGAVRFSDASEPSTGKSDNLFNILSVPKGGQWKLVLKDGTAIWLNAATTLRFPTAFTGTTREIYLEGEAYFEVAKDKAHPFIVHAGKQTVEVLGTHFNINAYQEENGIQTTLLEGSVRVNNSTLLKPGQQSLFNDNSIKVREADMEEAIAWKEGNFIFSSDELGAIMRQVSRWYNVDVEFQSQNLKEVTFSGIVSRSVSISTLLRRLSLTKEVHFKTEAGKILVLPGQTNN